MVHNEIVNIWSHFIGAVLIIILSIWLSTSFGNVDINRLRSQLVNNVTEKLQPLYNEFKIYDEAFNKRVA